MIGLRVGAKVGARVGGAVGIGADPLGESTPLEWTVDATSGKAIPQDATEAAALLSATGIVASVVALYRFGSVASGSVPDDVGSRDLAGSGTLTYESAVAGWTSLAIATTAGAAGTLLNNTFGNISSTNYTLILIADLDAVAAATKTLARMGDVFDDDATMELTTGQKLQVGEGDGTRSAGAEDVTGGAHLFALSIGATVNAGTELEFIVGGTRACNGTQLLFGGDNTQTWMPGGARYIHAMVIDVALTEPQIAALATTAGW